MCVGGACFLSLLQSPCEGFAVSHLFKSVQAKPGNRHKHSPCPAEGECIHRLLPHLHHQEQRRWGCAIPANQLLCVLKCADAPSAGMQ